MISTHRFGSRALRRIAAAAGITLGAAVPAVALAQTGSDRSATAPDPTDPVAETQQPETQPPGSQSPEAPATAEGAPQEFQSMAVDAGAVAEAMTGLATFFAEHQDGVGDGPVFLQPDVGCPVLPVDNLVWFADSIGLDADPLSAFASVDTAERAAPDLVAGGASASATSSAAESAPSLAEATPSSGGQVLVATCGFGIPSGATTAAPAAPTSASATTMPATTAGTAGTQSATDSEPAGPPPAEGMLLRVATFNDATFADDVVAQHPDAQVVSPTAEGLEGEIVGYCTPATAAGSSDCTVWWHDDGLGVGIELTGPTATFETACATVEAMVPSVVTTLRALGTGEAPDIPPPPTAPAEPESEEIAIPAGEISATVEGSVERGAFVSYWFWAGAGQEIELTVTAPAGNATFNLYAPDGTQLAANQTSFAGAAPAAGNYAVEVGAIDGTADYTVTLTITGEATEPSQPPSSPPSSEAPGGGTIEFPPGEDSATVEGELGEGIVDTWVLSASTGQTMEVQVYTDQRNAAFSLYGPDGDRLAENVPSWTGELPADGEYVIEVTSIGGQAVYELAVVIN